MHSMQKIFAEENSLKTVRSKLIRHFLFAACLCLLAASAHAITITCPAYPGNIKSTIGTGTPPAEPIVLQVLVTPRVGANALLCEYTVRVTGDYPPVHPISSCPAHPLVLSLVAPDPAPATGFTKWAFGTPGTPEGSSSTVSAAQSIAPIYSMTGSTRNCQVPNQGVFYFQIYSDFPSGETCTVSGSSFTCTAPTPPLCPPSLKGSKLPTANWSATSTAPGYYAYQSAILNHSNGIPIATQPSLSTIKSAMGGTAAFNAATFSVPNGTTGEGTGGGLPSGVISCSYDSPEFTYDGQPAVAQVTIACTTSCGSL
jgi:hypothetical protein